MASAGGRLLATQAQTEKAVKFNVFLPAMLLQCLNEKQWHVTEYYRYIGYHAKNVFDDVSKTPVLYKSSYISTVA